MQRLFIIMFISIFAVFGQLLAEAPAFAWIPNAIILGPGDGNPDDPNHTSDNLSSTGQDRMNTWKAFRWENYVSGDAYVFGIRFANIASSDTNIGFAYAIYDDNAGEIGTLKVWGYTEGVDIYNGENGNCGGVALRYCFDIQNVMPGKTRTLTAGQMYWIAFRSSIGLVSSTRFERGNGLPYASWLDKCIGSQTASETDISELPYAASEYSCGPGDGVADNAYGWTEWSTLNPGPDISSVSGSFSHGSSVTITGTGFGTKSPAPPLMWDDGEAATVNSDTAVLGTGGTSSAVKNGVVDGWDEAWPSGTTAVTEYRTRYRTVPYRSVAAPHSRSTKYLAGGHYTYANNTPPYAGSGSQGYMDVDVTVDSGAANKSIWYASWYMRLDPLWPSTTTSRCAWNLKEEVFQTGSQSYVGTFAYSGFCGVSGTAFFPGVGTPCRLLGEHGYSDACDMSCPQATSFASPTLAWIKRESRHWNDATHAQRDLYVNNAIVYTHISPPDCSPILNTRSFTIGGYFRVVDEARLTNGCTCATSCWGDSEQVAAAYIGGDYNNNAFRYFDDMYVDNTFSRVVLGNASTYAACTIVEPQIPSAWSSTEITVKVNLGKFTDTDPKYLFVFDSTDAPNEPGYPIIQIVPDPKGVFLLGSAANVDTLPNVNHKWIGGYSARASWTDLDTVGSPYNFSFIDDVVNGCAQYNKPFTLCVHPIYPPAYVIAAAGATYNPEIITSVGHSIAPVPWDSNSIGYLETFITALANHVTGTHGALKNNPLLVGVRVGFIGMKGLDGPTNDPLVTNDTIQEQASYSRATFRTGVLRSMHAFSDAFPSKPVFVEVDPFTDGNNNPRLDFYLVDQVMAEFDGVSHQKMGVFVENLKGDYPNVGGNNANILMKARALGSPVLFQACGSWFYHSPCNWTGGDDSPNNGFGFGYNSFGAQYYEMYLSDLTNPPWAKMINDWNEFFTGTRAAVGSVGSAGGLFQ